MEAVNSSISFDKEYIPSPNDPILESMLQQYERVLVESLITSFGLDFIVKDRHGGDVDTIHNVRQIGKDPEMTYKNVLNEKAYKNREKYDYDQYHDRNPLYQATKHNAKKQFQETGEPITDTYTGEKLYFYSKGAAKGKSDKQASIDHVLTAHTIGNDPGRVLAGLSGEGLANSPENLVFTSASLNSSMGATKESAVLVDVEKCIKANPEFSADEQALLRSIAQKKGANGVVDILAIISKGSGLSENVKRKVSDDNQLLVNVAEVVKKSKLEKSDIVALENIVTNSDGKINIYDIIASRNLSSDAKNKIQNVLKEPVDIPRYIELHPELDGRTKAGLMQKYRISVASYETKLRKKYYTSPQFRADLTLAATNVGLRMGVRQALGFVFAEMLFSVKDEFQKLEERQETELKKYLEAIARGINQGYENSKEKYPELFSRFINGAVAGALSSLTTTLCNIFFTTAKNSVRIIRQSYTSLVEAAKVLFINPDDYEFGDRMRAVIKVLSVGASVTVGVLVSDAVAHTPLGSFGKTGDIVQNFCGAFVTGIMSCTLLMYLDRSELMNTLVQRLNDIHTIETELNYYREWAKYFEQYAAQLMQIDLDQFEKEGEAFRAIASRLDDIQTEDELNQTLKQAFASRNLPLPWADFPDFNAFMSDKSAHLVFQ